MDNFTPLAGLFFDVANEIIAFPIQDINPSFFIAHHIYLVIGILQPHFFVYIPVKRYRCP